MKGKTFWSETENSSKGKVLFEQTVYQHGCTLGTSASFQQTGDNSRNKIKPRPTSAYSKTTHNFLGDEHMQSIFENILRHA